MMMMMMMMMMMLLLLLMMMSPFSSSFSSLCSCLFFFFFIVISVKRSFYLLRLLLLPSLLMCVGKMRMGRTRTPQKNKKIRPLAKFNLRKCLKHIALCFSTLLRQVTTAMSNIFWTANGTCRTIPQLCKSVMAKNQQKSFDQQNLKSLKSYTFQVVFQISSINMGTFQSTRPTIHLWSDHKFLLTLERVDKSTHMCHMWGWNPETRMRSWPPC